MTSATPGPWSFRGTLGPPSNTDLKGPYVIEGPNGEQIAIMNGWRSDVTEANAKLMASATDLYDAAENALDVLLACCVAGDGVDDRRAILDAQMMLREAIAKATGK